MDRLKQLDLKKTIAILEKNKMMFLKCDTSRSPEQAAEISKKIGFPVVLKIVSNNIIHKSDIGGVIVGIDNEAQAAEAYNKIMKSSKKVKNAKIEGVLVQKMEKGIEVIVGLKRDPQFGPVIMFGLGGIFVEIMKDTALRISPINKSQAMEMIKEVKAYPILAGARGSNPVNLEALSNIIMRISKLAENKNIIEIDFNPVIVNERSAFIADARIITLE
ncbi:MAG: acetate--CoA ligase family protein [Candidatus Woesearchaeota archaeon]|nr:acetate--CoA ligase family protein [Candidatus Woesearchaeota archaeon]